MVASWREEVSAQSRHAVINEMCSQLLRLHRGDKEQLQQTVMKYERAVWTKSADKEAYLKTLKAKMLTFKQQPTPNDATPVSPMVMLPANGDMSVPASPQVKQMETTTLMDVDIIPFSDQLQQQQQSSSSPPQPPTNLMQQQESSTMTSSTLHEQYQHRRVELIKSQYNETHQCCQSQLVQQTQLSASHVQQNTPMVTHPRYGSCDTGDVGGPTASNDHAATPARHGAEQPDAAPHEPAKQPHPAPLPATAGARQPRNQHLKPSICPVS
ncbi:hypothetical protein H257_06954 [Aphanomyces astaci]|uniref:Mediator complex subunit 15 KIX domain-containing protein n=1 Tax=Aphanomyces astaci TaxID=112090 RepID=W4GJ39_APHAT|nr:hypothetical protein H257_06954 [Aphanomyces astaci]ETV79715.1 hypothetical protein H257_06954 [Aphanomyces astaci]|eukprot:XP_009830651.1 hypothetical protein H257_06954 [Aphanomyces astaci]